MGSFPGILTRSEAGEQNSFGFGSGKYLRASSPEAPDPTNSLRCPYGYTYSDLLPMSGLTRHHLAMRFRGDFVSPMGSCLAVC